MFSTEGAMNKVTKSEFEDLEDQDLEVKEYEIYYNKMEKLWILIEKDSSEILDSNAYKNPVLRAARPILLDNEPSRLFVYMARSDERYNVFEYGLGRKEYDGDHGEEEE